MRKFYLKNKFSGKKYEIVGTITRDDTLYFIVKVGDHSYVNISVSDDSYVHTEEEIEEKK